MCFTTRCGSVFGSKPAPAPAPSLKLATNTAMFQQMEEDMDINCGTVLDGSESVLECGEHILRHMLAMASGAPTNSEALGSGDTEFVPLDVGDGDMRPMQT
jgi:altronate hydrolase